MVKPAGNVPKWVVAAVVGLMLTAICGYVVAEYGWEKLPEFFLVSIAVFVVTLFVSS